tara:strand:- start:1523 stop:1834 length:312 start_codon:yes stop_codon:yes gene_type:complete
MTEGKTTTLIGKWENQIESLWNTDLHLQVSNGGSNVNGLNILGEITEAQILQKVKSNIKNATVKDTGKKAFDVYKKRGESMRKNYFKSHPEEKTKTDSTSTGG